MSKGVYDDQSTGIGIVDEDLPIDIPTEKLIDWLLSRKKISSQWLIHLKAIHIRIKSAISSLPPQVITQIQMSEIGDNPTISYYSITHLLSLLEEYHRSINPSFSSTNWLGQFNDSSMAEWSRIKTLYERDNLFLCDSARTLTQAIVYDLPSLKKSIHSLSSQLIDSARRLTELQKTTLAHQEKFNTMCKSMQIDPTHGDLDKQLLFNNNTNNELNQLLNQTITASNEPMVNASIEYYKSFVKFSLQRQKKSQVDYDSLIPQLSALARVRKLPLYEIKVKEEKKESSSVEEGEWGISMESAGEEAQTESESGVTGDWNENSLTNKNDKEITAKTSNNNDDEEGFKIDWSGGGTEEEAGGPSASINWDIEPSTSSSSFTTTSSSVSSSLPSTFISNTSISLTTDQSGLLNETLRNDFITDLIELESFLLQRIIDLKLQEKSNDLISSHLYIGAPSIIIQQNVPTLNNYLQTIHNIQSTINNPRLVQLFLIKTSPRYITHLLQSLTELQSTQKRLENNTQQLIKRRKEMMTTVEKNQIKLQAISKEVKERKMQIENTLKKLLGKKKVNLIGEIANIE